MPDSPISIKEEEKGEGQGAQGGKQKRRVPPFRAGGEKNKYLCVSLAACLMALCDHARARCKTSGF